LINNGLVDKIVTTCYAIQPLINFINKALEG